jgi:hypothetical protein
MSSTTFNVLRVYGNADHQDRVCKVIRALFEAPEDFVDSSGTLLAAVRFVWLGESLVELVEALSRRMPSETFELRTELHSSERVEMKRLVLVAGQVVNEPETVDQAYEDQELQLRHPEELKLVLLNDGSVDYVATVIANMDRIYGSVYDDIINPLHWKYRMEMNLLAAQVAALESLLTPEEMLQVARHRERHDQKADELFARTRASDSLREAAMRLADPNVACLLEDEDQQAIERLSLLATKL